MALDETVQSMVSQLGQSQRDRVAPELEEGFVDVDERSPADLLLFTRELARHVRYYRGSLTAPTADWTAFFPAASSAEAERLLATDDGSAPPHLALLAAFLELHEAERRSLNRLTLGHLDFHFQRVLRFQARPSTPDHAHVVFELKKNAAPVRILPDLLLSAGKDATGVERIYQPVREAVVSAAKVDSLRTVFVDNRLHFAPIADSGDGSGGPLAADVQGWPAFGEAKIPYAVTGFALSSPVLRMKEGTRKVTLTLQLGAEAATALATGLLGGALEAFFTGEKSWLGPYAVTATATGSQVQLTITVDADDDAKAIVDYNPALHGESLATDAPVVQLMCKASSGLTYPQLRPLVLLSAHIAVDVSGITSLTLEGDNGTLDPKRTFAPFGANPIKGSRFMIGCPEALSKPLSALTLSIRWQGVPDSFATTYAHYLPGATIDEDYFTATATYQTGSGGKHIASQRTLFMGGGLADVEIALTPGAPSFSSIVSAAHRIYALSTAGSFLARHAALSLAMRQPVFASFLASPPTDRTGFITLTLDNGFLQDVFRRTTIKDAIKSPATFALLEDPYTPAIERISLGYTALTAEADMASTIEDSFSGASIRFFHVDGFGQRREHGYLRGKLPYVTDKRVPLFPPHDDQGELLVGLTGVAAGDSVSLLFEVAPGSGDPEVEWPKVVWSVLCDNQWKPLGPGDLVLDTTNALRASGLVVVVIPREATTESTILPTGRLWLKAAVATGAAGVSRLLGVTANGVEVVFIDHGNDPARLAQALPAGAIARLKTPLPAVKSVKQPEASFGGRAVESLDAMRTRAPERLRHKDRCITPWDYERIVLEAFPEIHRVKCIPHAKKGSWQAPGNVLLVVIPDLRNKNARDLLQPRVDQDTLARITAHVQRRAGMKVAVATHNPAYEKVRVDFKVKLRPGFAFTVYGQLLQQELIAFLSPWAHDAEREILFGGRVYRSVLLDFVEERSYVDYVTDFRMYRYTDSLVGAVDLSEATPATPDTILVSDQTHVVAEAT
ncbi:MAG: baseplate J/gp47 family protein [Byssovorax sp.]